MLAMGRTLTLVACAWGALAASEAAHQTDRPASTASLGPTPRTAPAPPTPPAPDQVLDPTVRLERDLRRLLREREERIDVLVQAGAAPRGADQLDDPALAEPRAAREQAWTALRESLRAHVAKSPTPRRDELDKLPGSGADAAQSADPIAVRNRLAAAEALKDLAAAPDGTTDDAREGLATLDRLDTIRLSERERALAAYLRLWFLTDLLRRMPDTERNSAQALSLSADAQAAKTALVGGFPGSELAIAAEALVAGLADPAP
jgi:hypothetical protein